MSSFPGLLVTGQIWVSSIFCVVLPVWTTAEKTCIGNPVVTIPHGTYTYFALFRQIEKQVNLRFVYCGESLDDSRKVTTGFSKQPLEVVLSTLFGRKIRYQIKGKAIILSPGEQERFLAESDPLRKENTRSCLITVAQWL